MALNKNPRNHPGNRKIRSGYPVQAQRKPSHHYRRVTVIAQDLVLETIALFRTPGTLSAWPCWKSPTARWEDKMDMTKLFRELLAMTGREKEATITTNAMLLGLRRHGLHDFCNLIPPLIDQTTFTKMACDELKKMKTKIYETQSTSPRPTTSITKLQSSPSSAGDDT